MEKIHKEHRRHKIVMIIAIVSGVILIGFVTWLIIALATQEAELKVVQSYQLPEFKSVSEQFSVNDGSYAVAVDGEVISENAMVRVNTAGSDNEEEVVNEEKVIDATRPIVRPTASTAKMILGLAVMQVKPFELGAKGEALTISNEDYDRYLWYVNNGGSNTRVEPGEEISEYDALMAVFLASSNNMADALAIWAFGSLENYRDYATKMLHDWGLMDTTIGADASGFDVSTTSTAMDLARIGKKILENPVLAEIAGTQEYTIPVAGLIKNTNKLLGESGIVGIKTGFIGDASGYCLVTGYLAGEHIMTTALMGAPSRDISFVDSLNLVNKMQSLLPEKELIQAGEVVGYYDSWWTGPVVIKANESLSGIGWAEADTKVDLRMEGKMGVLKITIGEQGYEVPVTADDHMAEPSFGDRLGHLFGWSKGGEAPTTEKINAGETEETVKNNEINEEPVAEEKVENTALFTDAPSNNCTVKYGSLMLINPNFTVENDFIAARRGELISLAGTYGINEHNAYNGDNLLDAEAAEYMNTMIRAYEAEYPGHTMETLSCFRAVGTSCGRLCAATGTSDHHTGLTCDLVDPTYGVSLDTSTYGSHPDWQWLKANSYKYGFIDRFPEAWAGGSMDEPLNVDENGSTGLFETWHYRYVGVVAATEIATGKYNNGQYDSLEHYLLARGMVANLKAGLCN